jgi:hypothetical protein
MDLREDTMNMSVDQLTTQINRHANVRSRNRNPKLLHACVAELALRFITRSDDRARMPPDFRDLALNMSVRELNGMIRKHSNPHRRVRDTDILKASVLELMTRFGISKKDGPEGNVTPIPQKVNQPNETKNQAKKYGGGNKGPS